MISAYFLSKKDSVLLFAYCLTFVDVFVDLRTSMCLYVCECVCVFFYICQFHRCLDDFLDAGVFGVGGTVLFFAFFPFDSVRVFFRNCDASVMSLNSENIDSLSESFWLSMSTDANRFRPRFGVCAMLTSDDCDAVRFDALDAHRLAVPARELLRFEVDCWSSSSSSLS